jgi:hypothetical protein
VTALSISGHPDIGSQFDKQNEVLCGDFRPSELGSATRSIQYIAAQVQTERAPDSSFIPGSKATGLQHDCWFVEHPARGMTQR